MMCRICQYNQRQDVDRAPAERRLPGDPQPEVQLLGSGTRPSAG